MFHNSSDQSLIAFVKLRKECSILSNLLNPTPTKMRIIIYNNQSYEDEG